MNDGRNELFFEIQELDRKRIARDLHDTSLQHLSHLIHKLELASIYMDHDMIKSKLEIASTVKEINAIIEEIRMVIYDLRPMVFDDLGLKNTIIRLLDSVKENVDILVEFDIDNIVSCNESTALGIFRIMQECIVNVCRHSKAKHLKVLLKDYTDHIEIHVDDDGIGFNLDEAKKKERHFGLLILEERVKLMSGKIKVSSTFGKGTKIHVFIPKVLTKHE
ncbi:MAG: hypothetical protein HFI91_06190 [Lachnospiraceae bacterium]|nr:hypothetical protein [Lachnospiraceae bacterium]